MAVVVRLDGLGVKEIALVSGKGVSAADLDLLGRVGPALIDLDKRLSDDVLRDLGLLQPVKTGTPAARGA